MVQPTTATLVGAAFLAAALLGACVTESRPRADREASFQAGQEAARRQQATRQQLSQSITVLGEVQNHTLPWTEELTLARAIVAAVYVGRRDPLSIVIHRGEDLIFIDPRRLLGGLDDPPLQPGDVVELRR